MKQQICLLILSQSNRFLIAENQELKEKLGKKIKKFTYLVFFMPLQETSKS